MLRILLSVALLSSSSVALAQWQYQSDEGAYYAWSTDGGFVDGSYENGLFLFCPDVPGPNGQDRSVLCEFKVTLGGKSPEPPAVLSFDFGDGSVIQRRTERVQGGDPQVALEGELLNRMLSEKSVKISLANGSHHTFSLRGSSGAIKKAMGLQSAQ